MFKKILACVTVIILTCLAGCRANPNETTTYKETKAVSTTAAPVALSFNAQYIRTNGSWAEISKNPVIYTIKTVEELHAYYIENKNKYYEQLDREPEESSDTIGFLDAVEKYDEAYFSSNILLFILTGESSGTIRHKVTRVMQSEASTEITVERVITYPAAGDMAKWHIMVELKKSEYNGTPVSVKFEPENPWYTTN